MAKAERYLFGFAYHRVGPTDRWLPSCATLRRIQPEQDDSEFEVRLALQTDQIVWIDVQAEQAPDQDINELSNSCESRADEEFRRLFPANVLVTSR